MRFLPDPSANREHHAADLLCSDPLDFHGKRLLCKSSHRLVLRWFHRTDPAATVAAVDLQPGDPLTASVVTEAVAVPDGWWAVPMSLGRHADPGDEVMLVLIDPPITIGGVVLESESGDRYSLDFSPAVVAVPGESAALAAAASAEGRMIAVVRP